MAQIDSSIYNALIQPPKSALDYAEQYAQADDRRQSRAFNALKMQEAQQGLADQAGYRSALAGAQGDEETRINALLNSGNPLAVKHGQEMRKAQLDAQHVQSQTRAQNSTAAKSEFETKKARTDYAWQAIGSATDPEAAQRLISDGVQKGHFTMQDATRLNAELQQTQGNPQAFQQWRQQKVIGLLSAHDQLAATSPKPTEIRLGDRVVVVDMNPNSQTYKQEVSSARVGVSPDSALSAETTRRGQNLTDARAREANQLQKEAQRTQIITDPNMGVLAVDKGTGTYKPVTGASGPVQGENRVAASKLNQQLKAGIDLARELLPKATASGIGSAVDSVGNFAGLSSASNDAAGQLDTLAGWMTTNVPRMQGPQSDNDVLLYRQMAGQVGDRTKPVSVRMKALDTLEQLQGKYADINGTAPQQQSKPQGSVKKYNPETGKIE